MLEVPQVRRALARESRQDLAGSSAKRCLVSLRGAWGILLIAECRLQSADCRRVPVTASLRLTVFGSDTRLAGGSLRYYYGPPSTGRSWVCLS